MNNPSPPSFTIQQLDILHILIVTANLPLCRIGNRPSGFVGRQSEDIAICD